eukprot:GGOE01007417.1.p1 GENE.GGOE01007417.1~~GGOE01007417.1.p1  ORF type:complete len:733 (-),score=193.40 GGOE01007417.1:186-2345(-)
MSQGAIAPTLTPLSTCGAVFACALGTYAALAIAVSAVQLRRLSLAALAALMFSVQGVFSLQFIAVSGMGLGLGWGFDVLWEFGSLACAVLLGTLGITLALWLRINAEPQVMQHFPHCEEGWPFCFHDQVELLRFLLSHLPGLRLMLAAVLLLLGVVGCVHAGMWSVQGTTAEAGVHCRALGTSAGLVFGLALPTCAFVTLGFVLSPLRGRVQCALVLVEVLGLGLYQFFSMLWGFEVVAGQGAGWSAGVVIDHGYLVVIMSLQGTASVVIAVLFAKAAIDIQLSSRFGLANARRLVHHLAQMDLKAARRLQKDGFLGIPSPMSTLLFQVTCNLELLRPYLPDTLFAGKDVGEGRPTRGSLVNESPPKESTVERTACSPSISTRSSKEEAESSRRQSFIAAFMPTYRRRAMSRDRNVASSPLRHPPPGPRMSIIAQDLKVARNTALGLKTAMLSVLCVKLQDLDYNGAQLNLRQVETDLTEFMLTTSREVKMSGGTIVQCGGELTIAMWSTRSPQNALHCAAAIQQASKQTVAQVVQCGQYLTGNVGDDKAKAFSVVGPLQTLSLHLLPLASSRRNDILITDQERETAMYEYCCLPYERIRVEGTAQTVYAMVPYPKAGRVDDNEWIYRMQANMQSLAQDKLMEVWDAYCTGQYRSARALVAQLAQEKLPAWYPDHLHRLIEEALHQGTSDPIKCLQPFSWTMHKPVTSSYKLRATSITP